MSQIFILFSLFIWLLLLILINYKCRNKIGKILNLIDKPDNVRKKHKFEVPLIGSFPLIIIFFSYSMVIEPANIILYKILFISFFLFLIGVLDDLFEISYVQKIIFLVSFLLIFLIYNNEFLISKVIFETINLNIYLIKKHSFILTIICLIILINTFNFTDGINGISSIIAALWLLSFMFLNETLDYRLVFFSFCILLNAIPIFLGKYFLGDSGTLFLGTFIGMEAIYTFNLENNDISYEKIFIIFMIPGFDMIRIIFSRIKNKKNPFLPDRNHLHHILIEKYSLFKTLLIYSCLMIIPIILSKVMLINSMYVIIFGIIFYTLTYLKLKKF